MRYTQVTTGWTEGKPYKNSLKKAPFGKRYGSDDKVDGRETVGNSLGGAPVGRSDTGVRTGWTKKGTVGNSLGRAPLGGNGWKQRLGGRRGKSSGGKEQCGSDDKVDGKETVGRSSGDPSRAPWEGAIYGSDRVWAEGKPWEIAWGELRWEKRE